MKFKKHSKYAPHMVAYSKALMNKFLYGVSDLVKTERKNAMLLEDMNISRLMTHARQVDGLSFLDRVKEAVMIELSLQIQQYQQVTPLSRVTHLVKVAVNARTGCMLFRLARIRKILRM